MVTRIYHDIPLLDENLDILITIRGWGLMTHIEVMSYYDDYIE